MIERDLLEFYNNLINVDVNLPVGVTYSIQNRCLVFTQYSWRMDVGCLNYYCKDLVKIKRTVLLPEDTKDLLDSLKTLIESSKLNQDRILVSPIKYGLEIYRANPMNLSLGPIRISRLRFITSNKWLFRKIVNFKYKNIIGDIKR
jgi:hypothetical protein